MKCQNCGNELPEGAKFCNNCGSAQPFAENKAQQPVFQGQHQQPSMQSEQPFSGVQERQAAYDTQPYTQLQQPTESAQHLPMNRNATQKRRSLLPLILGLAGLVVALGIAISVILISRNSKAQGDMHAVKNVATEPVQSALQAPEETPVEPAVPIADQAVVNALTPDEKAKAEQGLQELYTQAIAYAEAQDYAGFSSLCVGTEAHIKAYYDSFADVVEDCRKYDFGDPVYFALRKQGNIYFGYVYRYIFAQGTIHKNNFPLLFMEMTNGWRIDVESDWTTFILSVLPAEARVAYENSGGSDVYSFNKGLTWEFLWATDYVEDGLRDYTIYLLWRNEDGSVSMLVRVHNGWDKNAVFSGPFRFGESTEDGDAIKTLYGEYEYNCVVAANSSKYVVITVPADQLTEAGKGDWSSSLHIIDNFQLES